MHLFHSSAPPNAPSTQGYNRYAYAANNPARWTDPSGHSVGDVSALQAPIRVIIEQMQTLAALTLALMPVMLALGPFGGLIGLVLAIQFLMLAMLILMVIAQMLEVIQDPFSYYFEGAAPSERGPGWTPEELEDAGDGHPQTPDEECSFNGQSRDQVWRTIVAKGGPDAADKKMLKWCDKGTSLQGLVLLFDIVALALTIAAVATTAALTLIYCASGMKFGAYGVLIGCAFGFLEGAWASQKILAVVGAMAGVVSCIDARGAGKCIHQAATVAKGSILPEPVAAALWDLYVVCMDSGDHDLRACIGNC